MKKTLLLACIVFSIHANAQNAYIAGQLMPLKVVSLVTDTITASISIGGGPPSLSSGVSVNPDGSKVYITNYTDSMVYVFNTATNTFTGAIQISYRPFAICVSPDGSKVYVGGYSGNLVSVIDTVTNSVTAIIAITAGCNGICVSPDGSRVYTTASQGVCVINTATNTQITNIPPNSPTDQGNGIAITPDGTKLYVSNYNRNVMWSM